MGLVSGPPTWQMKAVWNERVMGKSRVKVELDHLLNYAFTLYYQRAMEEALDFTTNCRMHSCCPDFLQCDEPILRDEDKKKVFFLLSIEPSWGGQQQQRRRRRLRRRRRQR